MMALKLCFNKDQIDQILEYHIFKSKSLINFI